MNKNPVLFNKMLVIGIILLLLCLILTPITNARWNKMPIKETILESDGKDFITVTSQVKTLIGIKQIKKEITITQARSIMKCAEEINTLLDKAISYESLKEKIVALTAELKKADLLPRLINVGDAVNLILNRQIIYRYFKSSNNVKTVYYGDEDASLDNTLCFIIGTCNNHVYSLPYWRDMAFVSIAPLLGFLLGHDFLDWLNKFQLYRPKSVMLKGRWESKPDGSITTVGLNDHQKLSDQGKGIYGIKFTGFLGLAVNFGFFQQNSSYDMGGFIVGFCLSSSMYFVPYPS